MSPDEKRSRAATKSLRRRLTDAETILWAKLRRRDYPGLRFRRQHLIGPYVADFACISLRLVIELDGATHATEAEIKHDRLRKSYLEKRGWRVLRIANENTYRNLNDILQATSEFPPPPPPPMTAPPPKIGGGK